MVRRLSYGKPNHRRRAPKEGPEGQLQRWTAEFVRDVLVPLGWWATHIPNERKSALEAKILKGHGVTPGVADWLLRPPPSTPGAHDLCPARTIWIELKHSTNSLSANQRAFRDAMTARGDRFHVVRTQGQWLDLMRELGVPINH